MSVNLEWDLPAVLTSENYAIDLNTLGLAALPSLNIPYYLTAIDGYQIAPAKPSGSGGSSASLRYVADSLSQADGSSIQPPYIDGLVATFELIFMVLPPGASGTEELTPACGEDLRVMDERLMACLNELRETQADPTVNSYFWQPAGVNTRGLNAVMLSAWPVPDFTHGPPEVRVKIELASPYPYAVDSQVNTTGIPDGGNATPPNDGNCDYFAIVKAYGPSTAFVITNTDTGRLLSYDSTRPGGAAIAGGHYAEIDFFNGTILLDGNPSFDLVAGLDPAASDMFPIEPGGNNITAAGAGIDVLTQDAWV
jgi:hypothetical protein